MSLPAPGPFIVDPLFTPAFSIPGPEENSDVLKAAMGEAEAASYLNGSQPCTGMAATAWVAPALEAVARPLVMHGYVTPRPAVTASARVPINHCNYSDVSTRSGISTPGNLSGFSDLPTASPMNTTSRSIISPQQSFVVPAAAAVAPAAFAAAAAVRRSFGRSPFNTEGGHRSYIVRSSPNLKTDLHSNRFIAVEKTSSTESVNRLVDMLTPRKGG
jgi:hypothetical protein